MLLWILRIIAVIVVLKYLYLFIKRFVLLKKISKKVRKKNGSMQCCRNPLTSIFRHDGKTDISLCVENKMIDVSVLSTPHHRTRYHFDMNDKRLELILERRAVVVLRPMQRSPQPASYDHVFTIRKYKIDFESSISDNQKYVILHPAPLSVSKADGTKFTEIYNNDELIPGVKVCGLKWFIENILCT